MQFPVEEVFRTEGVPEFTFVRPPNYNEILIDIRNPGKPTIVEGQSGTGKTTVVKKIVESVCADSYKYLSARKANDISEIIEISRGKKTGRYIIDDFHRLETTIQEGIANIIKVSAEDFDPKTLPKIVIIGINKVGSELIYLVHDIAKRCGIHRISPGDAETVKNLIEQGERKLNIAIPDKDEIFDESKGDYWLAQLICQSICLNHDVISELDEVKTLHFSRDDVRSKIVQRLENTYKEPVKEFCRGRRFRPTNDPYFKLLALIGHQESSIVDLTELANANPDVRGSINNIKETRIDTLLDSKPICDKFFYYNSETKLFAIEDPAFFYYLRHLDWDDLRRDCGFREQEKSYEYDFAISFAGERRELAKMIADLLGVLDCSVFYDEYFENNFLGSAWSDEFKKIFGEKSRYVLCLLDEYHKNKIWPTFERECFTPRLKNKAVIPINLDDTIFPGIPQDIVGIDFKNMDTADERLVTDKIVYKVEEKLRSF